MPNKYHRALDCKKVHVGHSNSTFVAYVDESGDCGLAGNKNSSKWFIMAAYLVPAIYDVNLNKTRIEISKRIAPKLKELHMNKLSYEEKMFVNSEISKIEHSRCIVVASHKESAIGNFPDSDTFYNYVSRKLIEKITQCCTDWRKTNPQGDGCVRIVFSHRKHMNYEKFRQYLDSLKYNEMRDNKLCGIKWNLIKTRETVDYPSSERSGLQFADAVAHSFFKNLEKNKYDMATPELHKWFDGKIYNHHNVIKNYGITILNIDKLAQDERPEFFGQKM